MTETIEKKISTCEVCGSVKAKYTCPKCEVKSCSLTCVNRHKEELFCDGIRNTAKFVHRNQFTDLDLLSDYHLLQKGFSKRDGMKKLPNSSLTLELQKLKRAAQQRFVRLEFLPNNFSRHQDNTTYLNWETNELYWRIEWIFHQAENLKFITAKVLDTTRVSNLIEEILNSSELTQDNNHIQSIELFHDKIKYYRAIGLSGIKVLLKAENVERAFSKYYELDVRSSIRENLSRKTIIEYPTICLVLKDHSHMYEIIDSDDEMDNDDDPAPQQQQQQRNPKRNSSNITKPVNYFFNN